LSTVTSSVPLELSELEFNKMVFTS